MKNSAAQFSFLVLVLLSACSSGPRKSGSDTATSEAVSELGKRATGKTFAVAAQGPYSAEAAKRIMESGGNLVDAFVATSFTLAVELPYATGIGGGGFALFRHAPSKIIHAFDFRERAPMAAHSKIFLKANGEVDAEAAQTGGLAAGVPGLVAGVLEMHNLYGKLPRAKVLAPAIELAEKGFNVSKTFAAMILENKDRLHYYRGSRALYFKADGQPLAAGDLFVQKDLAETLKKIAARGQKAFYQGDVALRIINYLKPNGGVMEFADLLRYRAKVRKPIRGNYKGFEIVGMPPPSSGGLLIQQMLNNLENEKLSDSSPESVKNVHRTVAAMQLAFADRGKYFGDTDFVKMPIESLLSKDYAQERKKLFKPERALKADEILPGDFKITAKDHTVHFSMADAEGNVIASTQTINGLFGNAMVIPGTGILMNNEMDDFSTKEGAMNMYGAVGSKANLVAANKRPLSSMSPTMILKDGKVLYALGSPNGTRIITCTLLSLLNLLEYDMSLSRAIAAPRYHHQWRPDTLWIEKDFSSSTKRSLKEMGYDLTERSWGCSVQAVGIREGALEAVADPRGNGAAASL
jgi:gamma-glutamyltranspeptidase/glutathione hydrolase